MLAVICFGCALWAARSAAVPELKVYDGFLMVIGATLLVGLVAPLVWRWSRERSLIAIAAAATLGCVAPLVFSALHYGVPVLVRLRGAWWLGGADIVGPPLIIGFLCLWFAVRGHGRVDRVAAGTSPQ